MATVQEWREEIGKMADGVRHEKLEAIKRLLEWEFFNQQYGRDGLRHLLILFDQAQAREKDEEDPHGKLVYTNYDYEHQCWVVDGIIQRCGHPEEMDCKCYGKIHQGERA